MRQKVPALHTDYMLSTVGVLIPQVNYFSYATLTQKRIRRPSQPWGPLSQLKLQRPCTFAAAPGTVIKAQKGLAVTTQTPSPLFLGGSIFMFMFVIVPHVQREMLQVHLISNGTHSAHVSCKIPPCL